MKKIFIIAVLMMLPLMAFTSNGWSHCEVPCGIYHDDLRLELISEDIDTIEKSMKKIVELSAEKKINQNQLIRWVMTKEDHAKKIQDKVFQYFLTQKVKIVEDEKSEKYGDYIKDLKLFHKLLVYAMKSKQSTDLRTIQFLRDTLSKIKEK